MYIGVHSMSSPYHNVYVCRHAVTWIVEGQQAAVVFIYVEYARIFLFKLFCPLDLGLSYDFHLVSSLTQWSVEILSALYFQNLDLHHLMYFLALYIRMYSM